MSLDVRLSGPEREEDCYCRCGNCHKKTVRTEYYSANITHNLGRMAEACGLYGVVWRPEEHGITTAAQLIGPLRDGIERLETDPETYAAFNPENRWGTYAGFVPWLRRYLDACVQFPDATVEAHR